MMDDIVCDGIDIAHLKEICIKNNLAPCYSCWWMKLNAGYDVPYWYRVRL